MLYFLSTLFLFLMLFFWGLVIFVPILAIIVFLSFFCIVTQIIFIQLLFILSIPKEYHHRFRLSQTFLSLTMFIVNIINICISKRGHII